MFQSEELKNHIETSSVIKTRSLVLAEWNMNIPDNIKLIGNYRYRPAEAVIGSPSMYASLNNNFDPNDEGYFYTNATNADVVIDGGFDDNNIPIAFKNSNEKENILFSLEDCFGKFRPRSGINKARFFNNKFLHYSNPDMFSRPRYYMPHKTDKFKYWSSYRSESLSYEYTYFDGSTSVGSLPTYIYDDTVVKTGTVTAVTYSDTSNTLTYTVSGINVSLGDIVTVTNVVPTGYNITNATVVQALPTSFSINVSDDFVNPTGTFTAGDITAKTITYVEKDAKPLSVDEFGIANKTINGLNYISDASPFVVYKNAIPANRIVVKMQTNIGSTNLGPYTNSYQQFSDPFYGEANKTTPTRWKIQYLENNIWIDAISFNESSTRNDGTPIVGSDGYVEIAYGLIIPEEFKNIFFDAGTIVSASLLPAVGVEGQSYLVKTSSSDVGIYYVYKNNSFNNTFVPTYGWYLKGVELSSRESYVTNLVSPSPFLKQNQNIYAYQEFQYISGLRVVVDTMNVANSTFDLIELSPRLTVDLSDKTTSFNVTKQLSDIGISGLPVGQLLAGTGSLSLFDYDLAFAPSNTNSIISQYSSQNIQIKFYEVVADLNDYDYYVPIKTMYSEGFPEIGLSDRTATLTLRDFFFNFESMKAPEILLANVSLSFAISTLLDNIGFSNYSFYRLENEQEPIIPFFFIPPDTTVAEVLDDLARSTQYGMFFDEYNNFIVMSKNYMLPNNNERDVSFVLRGSKDSTTAGVYKNQTTSTELANILGISSQTNSIYNSGNISYTSRYIQKSYSSIKQASLIDKEKTWIYKPALLWEVSASQNTKTINDENKTQSSYVLSAIPLNTTLTAAVPYVSNREIVNNIIDFGEGIYWISRYNGYFYANGEIIKYDAVEYSIPGLSTTDGVNEDGTVWITSAQEYGRYFAKVPFNGKIYPTGRVRIYVEPNYETVNGKLLLSNGEVVKHGRGQFNTPIVEHNAGLSSNWTNPNTLKGCKMNTKYLFGTESPTNASAITASGAGVISATGTTRTGIIKNFLSGSLLTESEVNNLYSTQSGTIQSSAFVMTGRKFNADETPSDYIAYSYKELDNPYRYFGTRMRIVGRVNNSINNSQSPAGSSPYYTIPGKTPDQNITIGASSGGIAISLNTLTNAGYYFEIAALTENNLDQYTDSSVIKNVFFYKIASTENGLAVPEVLFSSVTQIIVDDGNFTGQYRVTAEENPTVYDLAVEYEEYSGGRRFYLYINNQVIAVVDDQSPLPITKSMALFVRGNSRCMFENIFAIGQNVFNNTGSILNTPTSSVFSSNEISVNDSFRKYALSGIVQGTYLSGISSAEPNKYNMYFEEFGTIMREAAYFNIRYDKAYPALHAVMSPTFNRIKGYTISGFVPTAYGAEFMLFNATDTALSLDETSGNYLRIQGVTFTQSSENQLTVDEYFNRLSDSTTMLTNTINDTIISPEVIKQKYFEIKNSRNTYGLKEFSLAGTYIQSYDAAEELMGWITNKIMKPRLSAGVNLFVNPMIQLGDIVSIDYKDSRGVNQITTSDTKFVVYNIEYSRTANGPEMTVYLSEVS